ncbi:MAG: AAA family ATPase [Lachnospiraceae bacterium]|nr:AAA family ATPase [Lachnospiraceae bacterium]
MNIIGRKEEQDILQDCLESKRPEFLLVYGRRRIGKTYLVKEFFRNEFSFFATGVPGEKTRDQLSAFNEYLIQYGDTESRIPKNWLEAFRRLRTLLEQRNVKRDTWSGKRVIFLDEMPWMATAKSDFTMALDLFWNGWASTQTDLLLIVCGSAASWIIDHILMDTGGMYNRITRSIHLMPLSLKECKELLSLNGNIIPSKGVIDCYMVFGGVPYYLNMLNPRLSLARNIDRLIFQENGTLHHEYDMLFRSLFRNADNHFAVLKKLGERKDGILREELLDDPDIPGGETLTRTLKELEQCGFVRKYRNYSMKSKSGIFQITDPFTLFALKFVVPDKVSSWMDYLKTPSYNAWTGNAFEILCLNHVREIKRCLGVEGVSSEEYAWRSKKAVPGVQIDLLIDRKDDIINLCEMKYSDGEYAIDAAYEKELLYKQSVFSEESKTRKALHITMVTSGGLKRNRHWQIAVNEVSAERL